MKRFNGVALIFAVLLGQLSSTSSAQSEEDIARKLAGKTKGGRRRVHPTVHGVFRRGAVEGRVDLDRGKMARVKLEPVRLRQVRRIKSATPLVKTPRARADANFLLIGQIQSKRKLI